LALVQTAVTFGLNGRVMHKNILTSLALNEAETLLALNHFTVPCSLTDFPFFLGCLVLLERPRPKRQKDRELFRFGAPLNESKGFHKSNKRNPIHTTGYGVAAPVSKPVA
jgi:hypothetical protein